MRTSRVRLVLLWQVGEGEQGEACRGEHWGQASVACADAL